MNLYLLIECITKMGKMGEGIFRRAHVDRNTEKMNKDQTAKQMKEK